MKKTTFFVILLLFSVIMVAFSGCVSDGDTLVVGEQTTGSEAVANTSENGEDDSARGDEGVSDTGPDITADVVTEGLFVNIDLNTAIELSVMN